MQTQGFRFLAAALVWWPACSAAMAGLPRAAPESAGMSGARLERIDAVVAEGLAGGQMPGCVVCIGRAGKIVWLKAYGHRQLEPEPVAMTTDTVFDMASLTKPVATATSIMLLVERGQLRLSDRVAAHLPAFAEQGKEQITVQDLLLHQSGLIADNSLADYEEGPETALQRIYALQPQAEPGTKFIYSDVGFIVLAELVRQISGQDLHAFSQQHLFGPLQLEATTFLPGQALRRRAAPTERREGRWMQGEVHDPRAYLLGGIAGHAGLFSTAEDLAVYAQMLLDGGRHAAVQLLSPRSVATMTRSYEVPRGRRGLGWDKQTGYSSNRGELFTESAFGHGGFTGTALWVDPRLKLFVIFLSNRLHPDGRGSVNALAGRVGTIAASAVLARRESAPRPQAADQPQAAAPDAAAGHVLTGIDVLAAQAFRPLRGLRVGLIANQTAVNRQGVRTVEILHQAPEVELAALFSPEHGFRGDLDQAVIGDMQDAATGLPIYSLYGESRRPSEENLRGLDALVFDIQDIGTRFYTYISTMGQAMEAAAQQGLRFFVLDRPNPINGLDVAGPMLDAGRESFVAFHRLPVRHGLTVGELARLFVDQRQWDLDLTVVPVSGWRRADFFDATGLLWVNPSPNMRSLTQALLYPGVGLLETTNLSVGRGTDTPFEVIGAPWLDGPQLAQRLNGGGLAGVRFVPIRFTPESSVFAGQLCGGVNIVVVDRAVFEPLRTGLEMARQLHALYPEIWQAEAYGRLLGSQATLAALLAGRSLQEIESVAGQEVAAFVEQRARYLLYAP